MLIGLWMLYVDESLKRGEMKKKNKQILELIFKMSLAETEQLLSGW